MTQRIFVSEVRKYDTNQRILISLADFQSRSVLFSLIKEKSVEDLAHELKIPLSSVYKKISNLEELSLVEQLKEIRSHSGKKIKLYRSRISKAEITMKKLEMTINLYPN